MTGRAGNGGEPPQRGEEAHGSKRQSGPGQAQDKPGEQAHHEALQSGCGGTRCGQAGRLSGERASA